MKEGNLAPGKAEYVAGEGVWADRGAVEEVEGVNGGGGGCGGGTSEGYAVEGEFSNGDEVVGIGHEDEDD